MPLKDDLITHTIFLQRLVEKERRTIRGHIRSLIIIAINNANQFNTLKIRNKLVRERAQEAGHSLQDLYDYERKFINKLLKKYEKNDLK